MIHAVHNSAGSHAWTTHTHAHTHDARLISTTLLHTVVPAPHPKFPAVVCQGVAPCWGCALGTCWPQCLLLTRGAAVHMCRVHCCRMMRCKWPGRCHEE